MLLHECVEDSFQAQESGKLSRSEVLLELVLCSPGQRSSFKRFRLEAAWDVATILWLSSGSQRTQARQSLVRILNFRRMNFRLFKELLEQIP